MRISSCLVAAIGTFKSAFKELALKKTQERTSWAVCSMAFDYLDHSSSRERNSQLENAVDDSMVQDFN